MRGFPILFAFQAISYADEFHVWLKNNSSQQQCLIPFIQIWTKASNVSLKGLSRVLLFGEEAEEQLRFHSIYVTSVHRITFSLFPSLIKVLSGSQQNCCHSLVCSVVGASLGYLCTATSSPVLVALGLPRHLCALSCRDSLVQFSASKLVVLAQEGWSLGSSDLISQQAYSLVILGKPSADTCICLQNLTVKLLTSQAEKY